MGWGDCVPQETVSSRSHIFSEVHLIIYSNSISKTQMARSG